MPPPKPINIAVIGAGPAGVAAAAAAASNGHHVTLIESSSRLGGSVSAAMHRTLCGLYSQQPTSPLETLNAGSQREVVAHMMQADPTRVVPKQLGKTCVLEFPAAAYEAALLHLVTKPNIDRRMSTRLTAVRREGNRITAIGFDSQWHAVHAIIDCTGSGAAMQLAGEDMMHPPDPQRMLGGYSLRLTGITVDAEMLRLQLPYALARAVNAGLLPPEARFTMFHPGPGPGEGICKLAVNPDHFADGEMPRLAEQIISNLKSQIPGFANVKIAESSPHALPRDGRRLKGKATVTEADVMQGRQLSPDAIHAWWPIETWDPSTGPAYAYPPPGQHYDISTQALQSDTLENLFAAGTCVSATATAAASLRASGICLATGHAAGIAACGFATHTALLPARQ
jgi:hypothetical protein